MIGVGGVASRIGESARGGDNHGAVATTRPHRRRPPELPGECAAAAGVGRLGRGRRGRRRRRGARRRPRADAPTWCCSTSSCPTSTASRSRAGCGRTGTAPAVVLTSSRDACDYGTLANDSGARGFVAEIRAHRCRAGGAPVDDQPAPGAWPGSARWLSSSGAPVVAADPRQLLTNCAGSRSRSPSRVASASSAPGCSPGGAGPTTRSGALMTLTGFAWFAAMCTASDNAVVFSLAASSATSSRPC